MLAIYLVRHAETLPDPDRPSPSWDITAAGHSAASSLKGLLPRPVFSSPEPKAMQTARHLAAGPITCIEEFREHRNGQGTWMSSADFASAAERYFRAPEGRVWGDSCAETADRFDIGLKRAIALSGEAEGCTIVSHGRILSSFLGQLTETSGYELWKLLTMPSVIKLVLVGERLRIETVRLFHPDVAQDDRSLS